MDVKEAIEYIEAFGWSKTRLGLERTRELLARLGDPQKKLKFVHVAGSNGKGSTCAMTEAVLRAAGYKTGLYISPYIEDFCERIQFCGQNIEGEALAEITEAVREEAEKMEDHPSQFELVTAIGMLYFVRKGCDIVVLEVGMGGELDSTNAIDSPEVAVITNIGLEHTEYLGNTLAEIASAKAGIIKPGCEVVCYDLEPEALQVVEERCRECGAPLHKADFLQLTAAGASVFPQGALPAGQMLRYKGNLYFTPLLGDHQRRNAAVAIEIINALRERGWEIDDKALKHGLASVSWPARFEVLGYGPLFILDGGHNPQCAQALAAALAELLPGRKVSFVMGVLADKDYGSMIDSVMPFADAFYCVTPLSARALAAGALAEELRARGGRAAAFDDYEQAMAAAMRAAGAGGAVVAFGSLYAAGAVRGIYRSRFAAPADMAQGSRL